MRTGAPRLVRLVERYGLETFPTCGRADVRPRRGGRAQLLREDAGRPLRRPGRDGRRRHLGRRAIPFEVDARGRRLDRARSTSPTRRTRTPGRSTARSPRPSRRAASRSRCSPAAARRRTRATSARSRSSRGRARCSTALTPSPCFLYGWPAMQAIEAIYNAVAEGDAGGGAGLHAAATSAALVWCGVREDTGESWADGSPHPVGQGASIHGDGRARCLHHIEAATRFSPLEVWEAKNPWLMELLRARAGLGRPRAQPRRARRRHGLPLPRGRFRDLDDRAHEECAVGTRGRRRGATELRRTAAAGRNREADCKGDAGSRCRRDPCSSSTAAAAAATARRPSATREKVLEDLREGYITEEHARRHYPHAFNDA